MHPVEKTVGLGLRWLIAGLALSGAMVAVDAGTELFLPHLLGLSAFGIGLAFALAGRADQVWFAAIRNRAVADFASAAAVVVVVTGVVGLVTLASSAALGFHPSTQFLQLLSALDIAWVTAALLLAVRWLRGPGAGLGAAALLGLVCVWSIRRYLENVPFGPEGEWVMIPAALNRYVLPFDAAAAVLAIGFLIVAVRARQATAQPSPQS